MYLPSIYEQTSISLEQFKHRAKSYLHREPVNVFTNQTTEAFLHENDPKIVI